MGKDGKPATPPEADEWEETPEGSTKDSEEFAGETEGFWKGMGFACNPTFVSSLNPRVNYVSNVPRLLYLSLA
jgi:hypothetical protein